MPNNNKPLFIDSLDKPNATPKQPEPPRQPTSVLGNKYFLVFLGFVVLAGFGVLYWVYSLLEYASRYEYNFYGFYVAPILKFILVPMLPIAVIGALAYVGILAVWNWARKQGLLHTSHYDSTVKHVERYDQPTAEKWQALQKQIDVIRAEHSQYPLLTTYSPSDEHNVNDTKVTGDEVKEIPEGELSAKERTLLALKKLPTSKVYLDDFPSSPKPFSVPIGIDSDGEYQFIDLDKDALHTAVLGATGRGKDSLIRSWYARLTDMHTPDEIQFLIFDGKGDWTNNTLAKSPYMFLPPIKGFKRTTDSDGNANKERDPFMTGIWRLENEIDRRKKLLEEAGTNEFHSYNKNARQGKYKRLPLLIIVFTDASTNIDDKAVQSFLDNLISKCRNIGVRSIISMQTPVGKSAQWRNNLSGFISSYLALDTADKSLLGVRVDDMTFRPSYLPSDAVGIFVARFGTRQYLVKTPFIEEEDFAEICEGQIKTDDNYDLMQELLKSTVVPGTGSESKNLNSSKKAESEILAGTGSQGFSVPDYNAMNQNDLEDHIEGFFIDGLGTNEIVRKMETWELRRADKLTIIRKVKQERNC